MRGIFLFKQQRFPPFDRYDKCPDKQYSEERKESNMSEERQQDSSEYESEDICKVLDYLHRSTWGICIDLGKIEFWCIGCVIWCEKSFLWEWHGSSITETIDHSKYDEHSDSCPWKCSGNIHCHIGHTLFGYIERIRIWHHEDKSKHRSDRKHETEWYHSKYSDFRWELDEHTLCKVGWYGDNCKKYIVEIRCELCKIIEEKWWSKCIPSPKEHNDDEWPDEKIVSWEIEEGNFYSIKFLLGICDKSW